MSRLAEPGALKVSEILRRAKDMLTPDTWTQYAEARNKKGDIVDAVADDAVCFCVYGAMLRICGGDKSRVRECAKYLIKAMPPGSYQRFNGAYGLYNDKCRSIIQIHNWMDAAINLATKLRR